MKTTKYKLTDKGTLHAAPLVTLDGKSIPGMLRVASVPPKYAARKKWAVRLSKLPRGQARHNTRGWSGLVSVYPMTELADLGIPHNRGGYVEAS